MIHKLGLNYLIFNYFILMYIHADMYDHNHYIYILYLAQ